MCCSPLTTVCCSTWLWSPSCQEEIEEKIPQTRRSYKLGSQHPSFWEKFTPRCDWVDWQSKISWQTGQRFCNHAKHYITQQTHYNWHPAHWHFSWNSGRDHQYIIGSTACKVLPISTLTDNMRENASNTTARTNSTYQAFVYMCTELDKMFYSVNTNSFTNLLHNPRLQSTATITMQLQQQ